MGWGGLRSIIILGVPFGFDESLGEWRVAGGGYRRSVSVSGSVNGICLWCSTSSGSSSSIRLGSSVLG